MRAEDFFEQVNRLVDNAIRSENITDAEIISSLEMIKFRRCLFLSDEQLNTPKEC